MKAWLLLSLLLTLLAILGSFLVWVNRDAWLPDMVPVHWGVDGQPDRLVPRDGMRVPLILVPASMVGMFLLFLALPWLSPAHFKIEPFRPTYDYIIAVVMLLFFYMHTIVLLAYTGSITAVDRWITGGCLVGIAALGNVLGKVQKNFYVGIRTPWTLASDAVWVATHRLGAWLFVAGGVVGLALLLLGVHPLLALSVFGLAAITPVFYSLWLYKRLEKQGRLGEP